MTIEPLGTRVLIRPLERETMTASGLVLPYAVLLSAGNDGRGALRQLQRIMSGYPFPAAAEPVVLRGEVSAAHLQAAGELGAAFAAGLEMGIF